ncbi:peptide-methionine (S)-S-oxide reductase [Candidatus Woesearchaeota archaeon]|nr:MAG: peptide-methionine (S)-S-oxide reductase [Candidatus Woesearchaeota archaeon]
MKTETATFAAGCFWGVQAAFDGVKGVVKSSVGYMGGTVDNPTYEMVCTDRTGHAEVVHVVFDSEIVSYKQLVEKFFSLHDPTQMNRQGPDVGRQYRSAIFYHSPEQKKIAEAVKKEMQKKSEKTIVTEITPAGTFYPAEEYHQKYLEKKGLKVCH